MFISSPSSSSETLALAVPGDDFSALIKSVIELPEICKDDQFRILKFIREIKVKGSLFIYIFGNQNAVCEKT